MSHKTCGFRCAGSRTLVSILFSTFIFSAIPNLFGQTLTTGAIAGTVKDQSGAAVPGATVTLNDTDTGASQNTTTNQSGTYQFTLLQPHNYTLQAKANGLNSDTEKVTVQVGQNTEIDLLAKVQSTKEVVEVSTTGAAVQTENANLSTTFTTKQVLEMPAPGGDITSVAFTVPGIAVSTGAGYGNFSSHGLPGTSNLFTINGDDYNDAYLNLNNSGASNLLLGQNEISEASVTQNGYSVQYGRQAGAQANYVTKSGTNQFHADLLFNFNNHLMNANDFFANSTGTPRPYAVSRQWGADIGGPVLKNKLFFYTDSEGLYYTLPSVKTVVIPSPQLETYILGNVNAASVPTYTQAFNVYNLAKGAVPVTNGSGPLQDSTGTLGCGAASGGGLAGIAAPGGGTFGVNIPCAYAYGSSGLNTNKEWLMTDRVDWNINDKQKIFFRFKTDHGFQPTGTNLLTPSLNEQSIQPQYEGQINHTYVVSPTQVNSFIFSILWYSAIFGPASVTQASNTFPTYFQIFGPGGVNTNDAPYTFYPLGVNWAVFPQGRDVGQGQIIDDYSWIKGNHTFKFGVNFRKNQVSDFTYLQGKIGSYTFNNLTDFANGVTNASTGSNYFQVFSPLQDAHIRVYNIGFYAQDEWAAKPNLKITLGLRLDRTANPLCLDNCFSRLNQPFTSPSFQTGVDIPYNASIQTGLSHAYYNTNAIVPDPRLGVVWTPNGNSSSGPTIRGGVGVFSDLAPAFLVTNVFTNAPFPYSATLADGSFVGAANVPGSSPYGAQAQYNAFKTGFFNGQTLAQLNASVPGGFSPFKYYSVPSTFQTPTVIEWSFEVQQPIGQKNVVVATYSGNHSYNLLAMNGFTNAFLSNTTQFPNGFGGLPTVARDPRFAAVTQLTNGAISNYNGLSVQYRRTFGYGFQGQASYTWSHAQDDISNGGANEAYAGCPGCSFNTLANPVLAANYGNADYDIRNNFVADFVWDTPWKLHNAILNNILGNWTLSGKFYWRSGTPFTIIDSTLAGAVAGTNINANLGPGDSSGMPATSIVAQLPHSCGASAVNTPCFNSSQFFAAGTEPGFGNIGRNSIYGPHYSDIDVTLFKNFTIKEHYRLQFGASAYNIVNHPNFQNPGADVASPGSLGTIASTAIPPTSAYGSFQGSAVSGRVLVVTGRFQF
ncbi:MAG: carboxypeptidase regulatory-like domain-containing protein [Acidobacteriaceae bacterium]|nr:carboxypeptidase regulatory-like domain-containing protein [Acidobacteriaceae bacterium]